MRSNYHIQEGHLLECVRLKVITAEQYEAILAVVRSATADQAARRAPDVGWITGIQAVTVAGVLGGVWIYLTSILMQGAVTTAAIWAGLAVVAALGLGAAVRRAGWGHVPAAILTASAAMFAWPLGGAAWLLTRGRGAANGMWQGHGIPAELRHNALLAGAVVAFVAAVVVARWRRVAAAGAAAACAVVGGGVVVADQLSRHGWHGQFGRRDATVGLLLVLLGAAMLGGARLFDRAWRGRGDPAFWVHLVGCAPLGFGAVLRISVDASEAWLWTPVAFGVAALGVLWDRRAYLAAGAFGLLVMPVAGLTQAHAEATTIVIACFAVGTAIAIGATLLRRYAERLWPATSARLRERTVWE